jgi:hypothetical protein
MDEDVSEGNRLLVERGGIPITTDILETEPMREWFERQAVVYAAGGENTGQIGLF